jgi:hypothetical protein
MSLGLFISGINLFVGFYVAIRLFQLVYKPSVDSSSLSTTLYLVLITCGGLAFMVSVFSFAKVFNLLP